MRYILGLREEEPDKITIAPVLPAALRRFGATYRVEPIPWGHYVLRIEYTVPDAQGFSARLHYSMRGMREAVETIEDVEPRRLEGIHSCEWKRA